MKRLPVVRMLICIASCCLVSCMSGPGDESYTLSERAYVDSIVYADRSIDSLIVVAARFEKEDNALGQVVAYRELGRAYRNATRYQEAIDVHAKGLEKAKQIRDTLQIVQALNNIEGWVSWRKRPRGITVRFPGARNGATRLQWD